MIRSNTYLTVIVMAVSLCSWAERFNSGKVENSINCCQGLITVMRNNNLGNLVRMLMLV
jgi:hypothetical protein